MLSEAEVAQSCLTLCKPMDCSLPGSTIHEIFQARILEWVAISFSRRSSQPRDWTRICCIVGRRFTVWATREAQTPKSGVTLSVHSNVEIIRRKSLMHSFIIFNKYEKYLKWIKLNYRHIFIFVEMLMTTKISN